MVLSDQVPCTIGGTVHTLQANTLVLFNNFERHCINVPNISYYRHTCLFLPAFLGTDSEEDLLELLFRPPDTGCQSDSAERDGCRSVWHTV